MRVITKFAAVAVAAAALVSFAAPANATIYIGLQQAGVNSGNITQVQSGLNFASYAAAYGDFELTFTSAAQGILPVLLGSTNHVQTNAAAGGVIDVYVTRDNITGGLPNPLGFVSSFTSNTLTTGWTLQTRTYYNTGAAVFDTTNPLSSFTFTPPGLGTFAHTQYVGPLGGAPYSITERYTITAPTSGESLASISIAVVPEPGTWALMIMGFGGAGAMLRSRRRSNMLTA